MKTDDGLLRTVLIVLLVILALPLVMMLVMIPTMGLVGWGHMDAGTMWAGGGWGVMVLGMLVPLLVLLGLGYLLWRGLGGTETGSRDPAIAELRQAYARGELSDDEFETRYERLHQE